MAAISLLTNAIGFVKNRAVAVTSFSADRQPIAQMRATEFRAQRDLTMLGLLVGATVLLLTVGLPAGERIIPLTAVAAIAIGWTRSFRETWSIGNHWLTHRRWVATRSITLDDLTSVELTTDVDDRVDSIILVTTSVRVGVPMHELRDHAGFADELGEFLDAARSVPGSYEARSLLRL